MNKASGKVRTNSKSDVLLWISAQGFATDSRLARNYLWRHRMQSRIPAKSDDHTHTHTHTHTHIYIYIYIYISSSSCRAAWTDFPECLSQLVSIIHRFWQVLYTTSCVRTELLLISSCWLSYTCTSVWMGPLENVAFEVVLTCVPHVLSVLFGWFYGDRWPYCCFVGWCFQDVFNIARSIHEWPNE